MNRRCEVSLEAKVVRERHCFFTIYDGHWDYETPYWRPHPCLLQIAVGNDVELRRRRRCAGRAGSR